MYPLLEETRAQLYSSMEILSSAPLAEIISLEEAQQYGKSLYNVKANNWKNRFSHNGKELYKPLFGDVFILADFKPETVNDLQREGRTWTFVLSAGVAEEEVENDDRRDHDRDHDTKIMSTFKLSASKVIDIDEEGQKTFCIIFLTNIIPNRRIWNALHMSGNSKIIKKILCSGGVVRKLI